MILYMYIYVAPGLGLTTPRGRNFYVTGTACHFGHLLQVLNKISLKSDFMQFFSWFYTCIQSRGRGRQPQGDSFNVNRNVLSFHSFDASFQKNAFEVWFYTICVMI